MYSDYDDYYPPPSAGFNEIEESLEQQYRSTSRSRDSGLPFFQPPQDATITRFDYFDDEEDYYQDEDDADRTRGNFWVNPDGVDQVDERASRRSRRRPSQPTKGRKPTTFRSGYPSVPLPVNELYNRLFWYGLDPDASSSPADRTMFGGTKGKFNGLSYLQETDGLPRPPRRRKRRPPPQATSQLNQDVDDDDYITGNRGTEPSYEDEDDESDDYSFYSRNSREKKYSAPSDKEKLVTPPFDMPLRRQDVSRSSSRQNRQRPPKAAQEIWDSPVARWFSDEDDQDEDVNETRRRKRQRKKDGWSSFNFVDAFLGIDRDALQSQAKDYEKRMGIDRKSPSRRRRRERPMPEELEQPARYDPPDLDEASVFDDNVIDTTANKVETLRLSEEDEVPVIELSWEERALAIERVPPAGIPAWGPTGELDFDARTKAVIDALDDIATAKDRVENRKKRVDDCREELSILRIDLELQKKRLRESRLKSQAAVERLRHMDLNMENTARKLRRELIKLKNSKQDLAELEARHWAVLGFYDPEQAGANVDDALREFKETEPAVRFLYEKEEYPGMHDEDPSSSSTSDDSNEG
jgi:hypothetical protein